MLERDEVERLVDSFNRIASALRALGNANATTEQGGLEAHGGAILEGAAAISQSIDGLANAIDGVGVAIHDGLEQVAHEIQNQEER